MHKIDNALTLSRAELRAVLTHVSKDTTRAHISGLLVDVERGLVVATDGHRLAVLAHADSDAFERRSNLDGIPSKTAVIVPRAQLDAAAKSAPAKGVIVLRPDPEGTRIVVEVRAPNHPTDVLLSTSEPLRVEAMYPPVSQVLPAHCAERVVDRAAARAASPESFADERDERAGPDDAPSRACARMVALDARYLTQAIELCETQDSYRTEMTIHTPTHPLDPVVLRRDRVMVVLMPKRI